MTQTPAPRPRALVVIDVQDGFDDAAYWGPSANPDAETNVKALLGHWAVHRPGPIVVVRHDAAAAASPLHPLSPATGSRPSSTPTRPTYWWPRT